ncbi:MAG: hypothetical protein K0S07_82 [Chlamydiales bacterium]|jgi:hypothetical protein|nr:hypothetical protein [Chlamydiales bacterium]
MAAVAKIEEISKVGQKTLKSSFDTLVADANQAQFEVVHLAEKKGLESGGIQSTQAANPISPIALLNQPIQASEPAFSKIIANTQLSVDAIDTVKERLQTPNLTLKSSVQRILNDKLNGVEGNLKTAMTQAGLEYEPSKSTRVNPVTRFLDMLTQGQNKLMSMSSHLEGLAAEGNKLSPERMLSLQLKMTSIQQELEFFTNVLNKSLESTKTLMNVQI